MHERALPDMPQTFQKKRPQMLLSYQNSLTSSHHSSLSKNHPPEQTPKQSTATSLPNNQFTPHLQPTKINLLISQCSNEDKDDTQNVIQLLNKKSQSFSASFDDNHSRKSTSSVCKMIQQTPSFVGIAQPSAEDAIPVDYDSDDDAKLNQTKERGPVTAATSSMIEMTPQKDGNNPSLLIKEIPTTSTQSNQIENTYSHNNHPSLVGAPFSPNFGVMETPSQYATETNRSNLLTPTRLVFTQAADNNTSTTPGDSQQQTKQQQQQLHLNYRSGTESTAASSAAQFYSPQLVGINSHLALNANHNYNTIQNTPTFSSVSSQETPVIQAPSQSQVPFQLSQSASSNPDTNITNSQKTDQNASSTSNSTVSTRPSETSSLSSTSVLNPSEIKTMKDNLMKLPLPERKAEELRLIGMLNKGAKQGKCYIISKKWAVSYTKWLKDVNGTQFCQAIPNFELLDEKRELKKGLKEGTAFEVVSANLFQLIEEIYGGGPAIPYTPVVVSLEEQFKQIIPLSGSSEILLDAILLQPTRIFKQRAVDVKGLHNQTNYCYLNASIQIFLSIGELNEYFLSEEYKKPRVKPMKSFRILEAFAETLRAYALTPVGKILDAMPLKKAIQKQFNPNFQQDAQELIRYLLGEIQDELNPQQAQNQMQNVKAIQQPTDKHSQGRSESENAYVQFLHWQNSIIDVLFAGQISSEVHCGKCNQISSTFDPFLDLSLAIDTTSSNQLSVQDCLMKFFAEEQLTDGYQCEQCNQKSRAKKQVFISKTPYILTIHLKRFKTYPRKKKITDPVKFPLIDLSIKPYLKGKATGNFTYNLFGIIVHTGTQDQGHYSTFVKRSNKWFYCNDKLVQEVDEKIVLRQECYLLFYSRVDQQQQQQQQQQLQSELHKQPSQLLGQQPLPQQQNSSLTRIPSTSITRIPSATAAMNSSIRSEVNLSQQQNTNQKQQQQMQPQQQQKPQQQQQQSQMSRQQLSATAMRSSSQKRR